MAIALPNALWPGPIREFFSLRRAEDTIRSYEPAQHERVRAHFRAAERRRFASRRLALNPAHTVSAAILMRAAVTHYLLAIEAARSGAGHGTDAAGLERLRDPTGADRLLAGSTDDARVRDAVASVEPLYFDRLSAKDAALSLWALERAASKLRRHVEPRTLRHVRCARWARIVTAVVLLGSAVVFGIRAATAPVDIARGKPVKPSSYQVNPPDGHELVDGEIGTSFGVHTATEENANVVIDLVGSYRVNTVKVYNRVDGWFDDIIPLVVELSMDGKTYKEVGRRDERFGTNPPWIVDLRAHPEPARYVRLRVPRRGYIALSEVEVFGKKM